MILARINPLRELVLSNSLFFFCNEEQIVEDVMSQILEY